MLINTMKKYIKDKLLILVILLVVSISGTVMAADITSENLIELPQSVTEVESGVVKLLVYAVDQDGNHYNVKQGTGILVETEEGTEIILTNDKLVQADETTLNNVRRQFGLSNESSLNICIDVAFQVGARVQTDINSTGKDFVILELATDISDIHCLKLGNSSSVKENDKLYLLSYGGNCDILGQQEINNLELQKNICVVSSVTDEVISTDYDPVSGDIGMPVFNAEGYVVGIFVMGETGLYIKPIDKIKKVLDVLSISYQGVEENNHYNEVTEDIRSEWNRLLLECQNLAMESDKYTSKSIKKLKEAITTAVEVTVNEDATYDDYQNAMNELNKYKKKLREKDYPVHVVQIVLGSAILLFVILGVRINIKIKQLKEENRFHLSNPVGNNNVIYAKLIRMDTMQEIPISNVIFRIGKNIGDVDYVIENNTSVSRHHADIMRKGTEFYILDNNSTNHTFVNGQQVIPGQYVLIKNGDHIRLSNVDFQFEV